VDTGRRGLGDADFDGLVAAALAGEQTAWEELVERLQRVAWKAIGGFDLSAEDRKDAFAATFFRLFERLGSVREPAKLPGWVATTARNEVLTLLRSRRRDVPVDVDEMPLASVHVDELGALLDHELHGALHAALARLSGACQQLLHLLTVDPPLAYADISELLDIPQGSLGPTRQRCLERVRAAPELVPFLEEAAR
jgi:RNA polymerase sigma factor (sigma-70 family)